MFKKLSIMVVVIGIAFSISVSAQMTSVFATYNSGVYTFADENLLISNIETDNGCVLNDLIFDTNFDPTEGNYLIAKCTIGSNSFNIAYPIIFTTNSNGSIDIEFNKGQSQLFEIKNVHKCSGDGCSECSFKKNQSGNTIGCECLAGGGICNHSVEQTIGFNFPWPF